MLGAGCSVLVLGCLALLFAGASDAGELTGRAALVKVYDAILTRDFDEADAQLAKACPPGPRGACDVLAATTTWWRILLDPDSRALDSRFNAETEKAIASTEAWVARDPQNAEAHFYAGGAYAARVQWRVLRERAGSPRRATASASSRRWNGPSRSTRARGCAISGSGSTSTTPMWRRPRRRCCGSC